MKMYGFTRSILWQSLENWQKLSEDYKTGYTKIIIYNIVVHNFIFVRLYQVIIQLHVSAKLQGHLQADLWVGGVYNW
jgi:hypothetical protein